MATDNINMYSVKKNSLHSAAFSQIKRHFDQFDKLIFVWVRMNFYILLLLRLWAMNICIIVCLQCAFITVTGSNTSKSTRHINNIKRRKIYTKNFFTEKIKQFSHKTKFMIPEFNFMFALVNRSIRRSARVCVRAILYISKYRSY